MNTGGLYRSDASYIQRSAARIAHLQRLCFEVGLNFYIETHVDRISEDVQGFVNIIDACPVSAVYFNKSLWRAIWCLAGR